MALQHGDCSRVLFFTIAANRLDLPVPGGPYDSLWSMASVSKVDRWRSSTAVHGGPCVILNHMHLEVPVLILHGLGGGDDEWEELDNTMERNIGVVTPHQNLRDLCRRHHDPLDQLLDLWICDMIIDGMVVVGKNSESLWGAVPHVDVHVHPARSQKCWVKTLLVIGREDDDPFLPACRPQPINKIEQPG